MIYAGTAGESISHDNKCTSGTWSLRLVSSKRISRTIADVFEIAKQNLPLQTGVPSMFPVQALPLSCSLATCREIMYFTALSSYKRRPS
jgi:hypothetical protein